MHKTPRVGRAGALSLAVWTILNLSIAVLPAHAATGFQGPSYAGVGAEASGGAVTGEKPESKLWFHNGSWYAAMVDAAASGAHKIYKLVGTTWTNTNVLIDNRPSVKEDVLSIGNTLYVLSRSSNSGSSHLFRRFTFNTGTGLYVLDAGPSTVPGAGSETAVLARDSQGKLWVTYTSGSVVRVVHTTTSDTTWGQAFTPNVANTSVSSDDISSVISFTDDTGPAIGVFWSNQNTQSDYFAVHRDGDPDTTWTIETALAETKGADDHINLKTVEGRVYAAVKTSATGSSSPLIRLLVRSETGTWTKNPVANVSAGNTRPITMLELDQVNRRVYVFYTLGEGTSARGIQYKVSPMDGGIGFGSVVTFIQGDNSEVINNATSMKANADGASGIVVLASDGTRYWWNKLGGGGTANTAPTATAGSTTTTNEDTATPVTLGGSDPETCDLTFAIVAQPAHGSLASIANQNCSGTGPFADTATVNYTPAANYNGSDSFSFRVNDGTADSAPATKTLNITAVADAPTANAVSASTPQDQAGTVTLSGSDPEDCNLTFSIVTPPANGSLGSITENTCAAGSPNTESATVTYTPNGGFSGSDSFTYKVNDGSTDSAPATASVTVTNQAPVASAGSATTPEDTAKVVTLSGSDAETCDLTFTIVNQPSHGSLGSVAGAACVSGNPRTDSAQVTYTPAADYVGSDSFTFKVNDGSHDSTTATVSLTVSAVNDVPLANAISTATDQNTALGVTLAGSDVETCQLAFTIVTGPSHGTLGSIRKRACVAGSPNTDTASVTYTPANGFTGTDVFTYMVNDGTADSLPTTVSITVGGVANQSPTADAGTATTPEDTAASVTLTGGDAETCNLTFSVVNQPAHGTLSTITNQACSGAGPFTDSATVNYTPASNYSGSDSFTFRVNDGTTNSTTATVSITVTAVNDTPVANAGSASTPQNTGTTVGLSGSDVETCELNFEIVSGPSHGSLGSITNQACAGTGPFTDSAQVLYTPTTGYTGADSFTFKVTDGGATDSPAGTISLTVTVVNQTPTANAQSPSTNEDTALPITLTGSDVETCELAFSIVSTPTHGSLGAVTSPGNNCSTGSPNTDSATVSYTPASNYSGSDSFTFRVNDGAANSTTATVSITVTAVNDTPVANAGSASTPQNTGTTVNLSGSDVETCELTFTIATGPQHGLLGTPSSGDTNCLTGSPNTDSGTVSYTPTTGYTGSDSFTYTVSDGTAPSTEATVAITVTTVNQVPTANSASPSTNEDTVLPITLTGSDVESCELTFTVLTQPTQGLLGGVTSPGNNCTTGPNSDSATVNYTPAANYSGSDSFTFRVNDGTANSATATISITVNAVNDTPVANAGSATTSQNTPVTISLGGADIETCNLTFATGTASHGTVGSVTNQNCAGSGPFTDTATVSYMPTAGYTGSDSFTFTVNDGTATSSTGTISITVNSSAATIAFRAASQGFNNGSATTLVIPGVTGVQSGDVMIATVAARGNPTLTAPAGWTLVRLDINGNTLRQGVYWKVATASEPSSYTWTLSNAQAASGGIMAYSGVSTTNPIVAQSGAFSSVTGTSATAPSITTTVDGAMVLAFFGAARNVNINNPAGMTERFDVIATGTFPQVTEGSELLQSNAGATGDKVATWTGSGHWVAQQIALRPSGA